MNGWTEDTDADIRTREMAEYRQKAMGYTTFAKPVVHPITPGAYQAHPRRTDWYRVAALTIVVLAACAAAAALIVALAYVMTAF